MDYAEQVTQLLEAAEALESDPAEQKRLLESAVRAASLGQDLDLQYIAKHAYTDGLHSAGYFAEARATFPWLLAQADAYPGRFDIRPLLLLYKGIAGVLPLDPHVSRGQIEAAFADLSDRYSRYGEHLSTVHYFRMRNSVYMGDREEAAGWHRRYKGAGSIEGNLTDSEPTRLFYEMEYWLFQQDWDRALNTAEPVLQKPDRYDRTVTADVLHAIVGYAVLCGEAGKATPFWKAGARRLRVTLDDLNVVGGYILYDMQFGKGTRAAALLEQALPLAAVTSCHHCRFYVLAAAAAFFSWLHRRAQPKGFSMRLGPDVVPPGVDAAQPAALADWALREAGSLASAFDLRSGNSQYMDTLARHREFAASC